MSLQVRSSFSGGAINAHIASELLDIAKKAVIFQQLGEKAKMPAGEGVTFQFNRYDRLDLPRVTLTEGVAPTSTNMALTTVSASADQWGAYVEMSDVAILTIKHPLLQVAIELLGFQAAELVDREIINMLLDGTSITYGGVSVTARSGLTTASTDSLTDKVVQKVVSRLRTRGAHPYEGTHYVGVIDPANEQDVSQSSNSAFLNASSYSNVKALFNGEIGMWRGVRWMVSNFIPTVTGLAAASYTTPASPAGTFAAANYCIATAYISKATGFVEKITQDTAVAVAALDSVAGTTPSDTSYVYKIYFGLAGVAAGGTMYQGLETTYGALEIPASTAFSVLAPPTSGDILDAIPATSKKIHFGWVFGKQAYCTVDLQNLQTYVSKAEATTHDPLVQKRTCGYKLMFKPVIQNENFLERFEVMSEFE